MLAHLSCEEDLVLDDTGSIWLQLLRGNPRCPRPCCPGFGIYTYRFDDYIGDYDECAWRVYLMPGNRGRQDWFANLWLVHKSRRDVQIPAYADLIYDSPHNVYGDYDGSPADFIADGCMGLTWDYKHTHVCMFYPF